MKLKRMWPGLGILIIFIIFDVTMVASSSFFSGLFPSDNMTLAYTVGFSLISILIMGILTFMLGKISDRLSTDLLAKKTVFRVAYVVVLAAIICCGVFYRLELLSHSSFAPSGKLSLYDNAMIGGNSSGREYDLLSIVYSTILKGILYFTGNNIAVALYFEIGLFMLFVLLGAIVCRILLGKIASIVFAAYTSFMPIFTQDISKAVLGTEDLFIAMFGIELLFIAIFLKKASDGKYKSRFWIIWYVIVGAIVGFMTYVDAGTFIVVLPLLIAVLFMAKNRYAGGILAYDIVIVGGVIAFFGMIIQEAGISFIESTLQNWAKYYFHNLNTFSMFWTYTNYKIVYLITLIAMFGVCVGYFRNRNFERVSPWLLSTILVFFATPFFGATRMNDQIVVTIYFAFVLACVASLIAVPSYEECEYVAVDTSEDSDKENESEKEDEDQEENSASGIQETVTPEYEFEDDSNDELDDEVGIGEDTDSDIEEEIKISTEKENNNDSVTSEETIEEADEKADEESESVNNEIISTESENKAQIDTIAEAASDINNDNKVENVDKAGEESRDKFAEVMDIEDQSRKNNPEYKKTDIEWGATETVTEKKEQPRFVPEGMVLPTGAEDEMDVDKSKLKLPKFNGVIALDRKEKNNAVGSMLQFKKDDFDIPFKEGDDFDL